MDCEICGSEGAFTTIQMDGSNFFVCKDCVSLGTPLKQNSQTFKQSNSFVAKQTDFEEFNFVEGFGQKIRHAREKKGLTVQELALAIKERESLIHKLEQEKTMPDKALAQKIEKFFGFKIIE